MIKYVIHPGEVRSKTDGENHFVGYRELITLYGVDPAECMSADARPGASWMGARAWPRNAIHLFPRYDGDYRVRTR